MFRYFEAYVQYCIPPPLCCAPHALWHPLSAIHSQVRLASKRFLAGSLGVAAGVMLYVSQVEIFVKSQDAFANHGFSEVRLLPLFWLVGLCCSRCVCGTSSTPGPRGAVCFSRSICVLDAAENEQNVQPQTLQHQRFQTMTGEKLSAQHTLVCDPAFSVHHGCIYSPTGPTSIQRLIDFQLLSPSFCCFVFVPNTRRTRTCTRH